MAVTFIPELAFLWTGHQHWLVATDQSKPLAEKSAYLLNKFFPAGGDPKWLILSMFAAQYGKILASGTIQSVTLMKQEREQKEKDIADAAERKKSDPDA